MADEVPTYDRQVVRGDCLTVTVTFTDSDGNPFNLTDYDAQLAAYDLVGASAGTHWLGDKRGAVTGAGAGTVTIDATGGIVTGTVPRSITDDWVVQKKSAKYQLCVLAPTSGGATGGGCRTTLLTGFVEVVFGPVISIGGGG